MARAPTMRLGYTVTKTPRYRVVFECLSVSCHFIASGPLGYSPIEAAAIVTRTGTRPRRRLARQTCSMIPCCRARLRVEVDRYAFIAVDFRYLLSADLSALRQIC